MSKIVMHIDSGLGNQMLGYCALLSLLKANPGAEGYVETIIYDLPDSCQRTSQWNGYELEKIFGINTPNVRTLFSDEQWGRIVQDVIDSEFWKKSWNYPKYITLALNKAGMHLVNQREDYENPGSSYYKNQHPNMLRRLRAYLLDETSLGAWVKQYGRRLLAERYRLLGAHPERLYTKTDDDIFTGLLLDFKYNGNFIEKIEDEIRKTFVFPDFATQKNKEFAQFLDSCNSVFIHARRGDMLSANGWCYKYGYFRRAVKYIKKNVENPVFVFFTNTGSIEWCKENEKTFGLDFKKDKVYFVDWNIGDESYRDMQLMSHCKHGIVTNSTFGWWGAYFIKNPYKITISPQAEINTTYHC